jgi:hypothetical protein
MRPVAPPPARPAQCPPRQVPVQARGARLAAATAPGCGWEGAHPAASHLGGCRACGHGAPRPHGTIGRADPRPATPQRQPSARYPGTRARSAAAVSPCEPSGAGGERGRGISTLQDHRARASVRGPRSPTSNSAPVRARPGSHAPGDRTPSARPAATPRSCALGKRPSQGSKTRNPARGPRFAVKSRPATPVLPRATTPPPGITSGGPAGSASPAGQLPSGVGAPRVGGVSGYLELQAPENPAGCASPAGLPRSRTRTLHGPAGHASPAPGAPTRGPGCPIPPAGCASPARAVSPGRPERPPGDPAGWASPARPALRAASPRSHPQCASG